MANVEIKELEKSISGPIWSASTYKIYVKLKQYIDYTKNTVTLKVVGVRVYCNGAYNFYCDTYVKLSTKQSDVSTNPTYIHHVPSASSCDYSEGDSYVGYTPRDKSYITPDTIYSKTFNLNDDKSIPTIYLYVKGYNGYVYYISAGQTISPWTINGTVNITSSLDSGDWTAPTATVNFTFNKNKNTFTFTTSANCLCDKWGYKLRSSTETSKWTDTPTNYTQVVGETKKGEGIKVTLDPEPGHKYDIVVKARRKYNSQWSEAVNTTDINYFNPSISSFNIEHTGNNNVKVQFKTNHNCSYTIRDNQNYIKCSGNATKGVVVETNFISSTQTLQNYTLTVTRSDYNELTTSKTINYDFAIPVITLQKLQYSTNYLKIQATSNIDIISDGWQSYIQELDSSLYNCKITSINSRTATIEYTLKNIEFDPDITYNINVSGRSINNIGSNTITHTPEQTNTIDIFVGDEFIPAVPYVYDNGEWKETTPYVREGSVWLQCSN